MPGRTIPQGCPARGAGQCVLSLEGLSLVSASSYFFSEVHLFLQYHFLLCTAQGRLMSLQCFNLSIHLCLLLCSQNQRSFLFIFEKEKTLASYDLSFSLPAPNSPSDLRTATDFLHFQSLPCMTLTEILKKSVGGRSIITYSEPGCSRRRQKGCKV